MDVHQNMHMSKLHIQYRFQSIYWLYNIYSSVYRDHASEMNTFQGAMSDVIITKKNKNKLVIKNKNLVFHHQDTDNPKAQIHKDLGSACYPCWR